MIEEHWAASERGDVDAEHARYADGAVLDHPQSGERFRAGRRSGRTGGHPADRFAAPLSRAALAERIPDGER